MLVLTPPAEAVVLLREVGELEVERERPENLRLALERKGGNRGREPGAGRRAAGGARSPGQLPDVLLFGEQVLAGLLDENATEDLTEKADVSPQRRVGASGAQGFVTAPSLADETRAAYLASTPLS
jgi:hypothetical protein